MGLKLPVRSISWKQAWRIIPTRYPEENVYRRVSNPNEFDDVQRIERLTNDRIRQEQNDITSLRRNDRLPHGKSAYNVTAAFSFPASTRFTDGSFAAYYAAKSLKTAVVETVYHREQFFRATNEEATALRMRVLVANVRGSFHDIRGKKKRWPEIYSSTSYAASQALGRRLWGEDSNGLLYDSVRHTRGECASIFRPQLIQNSHQDRCLQYEWNGRQIIRVLEIKEFLP